MDDVTTLTVKAIVAACAGMEIDQISEEDNLVEDLDLDSLELVELGLHLEESLGIEIPDSSVRSNMTVGELIDEVRRLQQFTTKG